MKCLDKNLKKTRICFQPLKHRICTFSKMFALWINWCNSLITFELIECRHPKSQTFLFIKCTFYLFFASKLECFIVIAICFMLQSVRELNSKIRKRRKTKFGRILRGWHCQREVMQVNSFLDVGHFTIQGFNCQISRCSFACFY
jgi:hypothetical protein